MKLTQILDDIQYNSLQSMLNDYASEFERLYKQELESKGHKATGGLINSITTKVNVGGDYFEVVFNAKDYWRFVEEGRGSGKFPPINKIEEWIVAKKIMPTPINGKLPTQKQLAYLIGRSIAEHGTIKQYNYEGSKIVAKTVAELNAKYMPLLEDALQKDFEHIMIKVYDGIGQIRIY